MQILRRIFEKVKQRKEEGVVLIVNVTASEQEYTIENLKKW